MLLLLLHLFLRLWQLLLFCYRKFSNVSAAIIFSSTSSSERTVENVYLLLLRRLRLLLPLQLIAPATHTNRQTHTLQPKKTYICTHAYPKTTHICTHTCIETECACACGGQNLITSVKIVGIHVDKSYLFHIYTFYIYIHVYLFSQSGQILPAPHVYFVKKYICIYIFC